MSEGSKNFKGESSECSPHVVRGPRGSESSGVKVQSAVHMWSEGLGGVKVQG